MNQVAYTFCAQVVRELLKTKNSMFEWIEAFKQSLVVIIDAMNNGVKFYDLDKETCFYRLVQIRSGAHSLTEALSVVQ